MSTADAQDSEAFASPALQAKKGTWTWTARLHGQRCAMDIGNRADTATPPSHGARPSRHEVQIFKLSSSRWPHLRHRVRPLMGPAWDTREGVALGGPGAWECARLSPRHTSRRQASRNRLMSPRAGHRQDQAWVSAGTSDFQFWQRATRRNGRRAAAGPPAPPCLAMSDNCAPGNSLSDIPNETHSGSSAWSRMTPLRPLSCRVSVLAI